MAPAIKQLFGAVKRRFPALRTMATLRWDPLHNSAGVDLRDAVDIWVNLYSLWNASAATASNYSYTSTPTHPHPHTHIHTTTPTPTTPFL